jgi:hypothetical protein
MNVAVRMTMSAGGSRSSSRFALLVCGAVVAGGLLPLTVQAQSLPDAPSVVLLADSQTPATSADRQRALTDSSSAAQVPQANSPEQRASAQPAELPPCSKLYWGLKVQPREQPSGPCAEDPFQLIVNPGDVTPLTPTQKGLLATRVTIDPFNLATVALYSGFYVGFNSHSAYGPGFKGFGRLTGYSLLGDAQGNFFGIYAIPTLAHEDPRYHRLPGRPVKIRILHALAHTIISQHDDGTLMPNYATLLTYPISAELSNLYVPGIGSNGPSTVKRIALGYATDPSSALIAEFLPDFAKRVHVHIVFVQQLLLQVENNNSRMQ